MPSTLISSVSYVHIYYLDCLLCSDFKKFELLDCPHIVNISRSSIALVVWHDGNIQRPFLAVQFLILKFLLFSNLF